MNSSFHIILNEIRNRYAQKHVSMIDIFAIEEAYKLCSIVNTRNDNCAFLRITSFGLDEVVFEDIVTNIDLLKNYSSIEDFDFEIKKNLYNQAYGVILEKSDKKILDSKILKPSFDFLTDKEEINRLKKRCSDLEKELLKRSDSPQQPSLFDNLDI